MVTNALAVTRCSIVLDLTASLKHATKHKLGVNVKAGELAGGMNVQALFPRIALYSTGHWI